MPQGPGTYGKTKGRPPKPRKVKKPSSRKVKEFKKKMRKLKPKKQIMAGKRLDLFNHDKKSTYHI